MALTGWSTGTNYLSRSSAVVSAYPFHVSFWAYRDWTTATNHTVVAVENAANQRRGTVFVAVPVTFNVTASVYNGTAEESSATTGTFPFQSWTQGSGSFVTTTLRESRHSGGNLGIDTGPTNDPSAADRLWIGNGVFGDGFHATSGLAEVSIWAGGSMSEANRTSLDVLLAAGDSPIAINAQAAQPWTGLLVAYWRLLNATDLADYAAVGPFNLTMVGTLTTFASHPPVDEPPSGRLIDVMDAMEVADTQRVPVS